jgi:hypothetical protein
MPHPFRRTSRRIITLAVLLLGLVLGAMLMALLIHELGKRHQGLTHKAYSAQQSRQPDKAACQTRPHWDPHHGRCERDRLTIKGREPDGRELPGRWL